MALPMMAAYDRSGLAVEYGPGGRVKGRWSSPGGSGLILGDDTRFTIGGELERGVVGSDAFGLRREGVFGTGLRGKGTLKRPRSRLRDGVSGKPPSSCEDR